MSDLNKKLDTVNETIYITRAEYGWIFETSGGKGDGWKNVKILVNTSDTLYSLIAEHAEMKID
jgi:hypothetical protein